MKTIIAGSRSITDFKHVDQAIDLSGFTVTEVVSGAARGVDKLGEEWAEINDVPVKRFPAKWDTYGRAAGHIRNGHMADYAEALIAVWDGESRGTLNMITQAKCRGLHVYVHIVGSGSQAEGTV